MTVTKWRSRPTWKGRGSKFSGTKKTWELMAGGGNWKSALPAVRRKYFGKKGVVQVGHLLPGGQVMWGLRTTNPVVNWEDQLWWIAGQGGLQRKMGRREILVTFSFSYPVPFVEFILWATCSLGSKNRETKSLSSLLVTVEKPVHE